MIAIDYQGGAHGNFLEVVCNLAAGISSAQLPFDSLGASHHKTYKSQPLFRAAHYSFRPIKISTNKIIAILIDVDDLLPLLQVSLLRAANQNINNDLLEIDTYHKLNNVYYRDMLDEIIQTFFANQVKTSYNNVKDSSWPNIETIKDFDCLPDQIKQECLTVHGLKLLELNEQQPNCPREVLREFYQIGFEHPEKNGFIIKQNTMPAYSDKDVFYFPFCAFYQQQMFLEEIEKIASWACLYYTCQDSVKHLHSEFLSRQPYKDSKIKCDMFVQQMLSNSLLTPKLTLLEEAYINAMLRKHGHECRY